MKLRLGDIDKLEKLSYDKYETLLKTSFKKLQNLEEPVEYFLLMGDTLPWKDSDDPEKQPLLYIGDTNKWMRWLKDSDQRDLYRAKDNFSQGLCKVSLNRNRATVSLLPKTGILTRDQQNFKVVEKVFNKMSPTKVFFEIVDSFAAPEPKEEDAVDPALQRPLELAKALTRQHQQFLGIHRQWRAETNAEKKATLNTDRKEIAEAIKALVIEWDQIVVDTQLAIKGNTPLEKAHELHEDWAERLKLDLDEDDEVGADNTADVQRALEIAEALSNRHDAFVEAHKAWRAENDPEQKNALNAARKAIAEELEDLAIEWDDLVVDTGMDITGNEMLEKGHQLHKDWAERLGLDLDEDDELSEEDLGYALQIDYLEEELKRIIDTAGTPEEIDQQLQMLVENLQKWEAQGSDSRPLKATQQRLKEAQKQWATIKALYEKWHALYQRLEKEADVDDIMKELEATYEAIQNFEEV